jgi:predicted aspartyl protease
LIIDTGAYATGISAGFARELGLSPSSKRTVTTAYEKVKMSTSRIDKATLGGIAVENLMVEYPEGGQFEIRPHLGRDILIRYRILIDIPNKKMLVKLAKKR